MWGIKRWGLAMHRSRRGAVRLARETRGATIIEFAIVAAPFIALLIATLQTSLVFFAQQTLETVSEETSRQILTGAVRSSTTGKDDFHKLACKNLPSFMNCADLMIDVQTADSFADADTSAPALYDEDGNLKTWDFKTGSAGDIVVMRTMYLLPVVGGPFGFNLANAGNGKRLLIATSVFRTEPYLT
jgi:Flp pilus assembly protein TadG